MEDPLPGREREVDAVAELVREREHVTAARGVVEQHVRRRRGHGGRAECAPALGRAHRGVDAPLAEEALGKLAELGREGGVALEHDPLGAREGERGHVLGDGRHAVVVGEALDAEQLRLQAIPAARDLLARAHGLDQRAHGLIARLVGEVARRQPVRVATQAVVDRLVREQRVEKERARAQAWGERRRHRLGGRLPEVSVG